MVGVVSVGPSVAESLTLTAPSSAIGSQTPAGEGVVMEAGLCSRAPHLPRLRRPLRLPVELWREVLRIDQRRIEYGPI